jgi:peptidoglycan/xylan/chitin deacetylase (PgdA/CDA1 family)
MKAILTYHSIDDSRSPISVSRAAFEQHVAWLASGRVRVTTVPELASIPSDQDAVAITFDDGFQSFADIAAPLLLSHGLPVTVFVVSSHVGGTNAWGGKPATGSPTLPLLGWREIEQLLRRGVDIGGHTRTHPHLSMLTHDEQVSEIVGGAREIEARTGRAPDAFAYPYGDVSESAAAIVRTHFRWACTTELQPLGADDDAALLPRLDMYYFRGPGQLERWGSTRFKYYLSMRSRARRIRQRWTGALSAP